MLGIATGWLFKSDRELFMFFFSYLCLAIEIPQGFTDSNLNAFFSSLLALLLVCGMWINAMNAWIRKAPYFALVFGSE